MDLRRAARFYDGAYVKREHVRRIVRQAIADVPGAFR